MNSIPHPPSKGTTLIELMIAIAIVGILLAIGIPSFQSAMNSTRLSNVSNELLNDLMTARTHAVSKGVRIVVCPSNDQATCTAATLWSAGWIIFEDNNRNGAANPGEFILRTRQALPTNIVTTGTGGAVGAVTFLPSGTIGGIAGSVQFCIPTTQPAENRRDVVIAAPSGRMRVRPVNNAGVCP